MEIITKLSLILLHVLGPRRQVSPFQFYSLFGMFGENCIIQCEY